MLRYTLIALALIAGVSAKAIVKYTYSDGLCTKPNSAEATALGECISFTSVSVRLAAHGNNYTTTTYRTTDCTGQSKTDETETGVCQKDSGGTASYQYVIQGSFTPALTASDLVTSLFF